MMSYEEKNGAGENRPIRLDAPKVFRKYALYRGRFSDSSLAGEDGRDN